MTGADDWGARLEGALARAKERDDRVASRLTDRDGRPPEPGDVYLAIPDTGDREWVVVGFDEVGRRARVVSADQDPIAGSGDVRVEDGSDCAPLTARCRLAPWIRAGDLDGARRTGGLAQAELALLQQRLILVDEGRLTPTPLEEEVDQSPAYLELCGALRALPDRWAEPVAPPVRPPPAVTALHGAARGPRWRGRVARTLATAAAVVAVTLAARLVPRLGTDHVGYRGAGDRAARLILRRVSLDEGRIVELHGASPRLDSSARLAIVLELATPATVGIYAVDPDGHAARLGCAPLDAGRHRLAGDGRFGPDVAETGHAPFALSPAGRHVILAAVGSSAACPGATDLGPDPARGLDERGWVVTSTTVEVAR